MTPVKHSFVFISVIGLTESTIIASSFPIVSDSFVFLCRSLNKVKCNTEQKLSVCMCVRVCGRVEEE